MDIVLDPPGLKGVYEGSEHESAHNVLYQLILAEGTVPTVVTHHKELHTHNNPYCCQQSFAFGHVVAVACKREDALLSYNLCNRFKDFDPQASHCPIQVLDFLVKTP